MKYAKIISIINQKGGVGKTTTALNLGIGLVRRNKKIEREDAVMEGDSTAVIPADPEVRNFSYTVVDGEIYFRTDSVMNKYDGALTAQNRIKGLIGIRESVRRLFVHDSSLHQPEPFTIIDASTDDKFFYEFIKSQI